MNNINNNINNMTWCDKYKPATLSEILLPKEEINKIKKWIKNFKDKKPKCKNCLFLHGPPGLGKTTVANIILKENNYDILEYNASDIRNQKLIRDKLSRVNSNINVIESMCFKKKFIGVIFDEIDGLSFGEKSGLTEICSIIFNKKNIKNTPFICISNKLSKKIDIIRKKSIYIKINKPSKFMLKKILKKICINEKINIDTDIENLIVNNSNLDIRRLITLLEYLFNNNKSIDINHIESLIANFQKKNIQLTSYEATDKIINKYDNINNILQIYENDKNNIGMCIFENFINFLVNNRKANNLEKLKNINFIYRTFKESDNYDYELYMIIMVYINVVIRHI